MTASNHELPDEGRASVDVQELLRLVDNPAVGALLDLEDRILIVVEKFLAPLVRNHGWNGIQDLIAHRHSSPMIALVLVHLASSLNVSPLLIFEDHEIVQGAARFLEDHSDDYGWAWTALWSDDFEPGQKWQLIMRLIEVAPSTDAALWMIGDGPIAQLEMEPGAVEALEKLAQENPRLARILKLVQEIP